MTEAEFIAVLQAFNAEGASLTWSSTYQLHATIPEGDIISSDPAYTGDPIAPDTHVFMVVSLGAVSSRWASVAFHEAAEQAIGVPVLYVFMDFEDDPTYANLSNVTFEWDGHLWLGTGEVGGIEFPDETSDLTPQSLRLTLSGVDTSLIAVCREVRYKDAPVTVYIAMHHPETLGLLGTPEEFWSGYADVMRLEADKGVAKITLTCEHWFRKSVAVSRNTDEEQQSLFSGDRFFQYLSGVRNKGKWGGKTMLYGDYGGSGNNRGGGNDRGRRNDP